MSDRLREAIIHENEFGPLLVARCAEFARYLNLLCKQGPREWSKRHYRELVERSHEVETFLDDFNARNNKSFCFVTEAIASLRGFGKAATALTHTLGRFDRYKIQLEKELVSAFFSESERTVEFFRRSILALIEALRVEFRRLGLDFGSDIRPDSTVAEEGIRRMLPHNIDEEDVLDEEQRIAEVATKYFSAADSLRWACARPIRDEAELRRLVLERLDEESARHYESIVHSIQSKYDTYIKSTALETQNPVLPRLRGHASLALHLLELATELIHFYVRHENDIRYEGAKARIAEHVDKRLVLDRTVNYAFYYAATVLQCGRSFAEEVLNLFVRLQRLELELPETATLHARPISLIVRIINHHGTRVEMEVDGNACDASSIMEMILLIGSHPTARRVVFKGDARPLADVKALFDHRLGEDGIESLPEALRYLK